MSVYSLNGYRSGSQGGWAGQPAASPTAASYSNLPASQSQGMMNSPAAAQQSSPVAAPACGSAAAPTASTQQICSCITVNAAAAQQSSGGSGSADQAAAPIPSAGSSSSSSAAAAQSQSYSVPTTQGAQQTYSSQSAPVQNGGDNRGQNPVYAGASKGGY